MEIQKLERKINISIDVKADLLSKIPASELDRIFEEATNQLQRAYAIAKMSDVDYALPCVEKNQRNSYQSDCTLRLSVCRPI